MLFPPLVEEPVVRGLQVFDLHLVIVHPHGGQGTGHLLLRAISIGERRGQNSLTLKAIAITPEKPLNNITDRSNSVHCSSAHCVLGLGHIILPTFFFYYGRH